MKFLNAPSSAEARLLLNVLGGKPSSSDIFLSVVNWRYLLELVAKHDAIVNVYEWIRSGDGETLRNAIPAPMLQRIRFHYHKAITRNQFLAEELLALLDFPDSALADYDDDRIFRSRAGKIIAALTPVGTKPKAWWV